MSSCVFRFDYGHHVGGGHASRALTLADLANVEAVLAVKGPSSSQETISRQRDDCVAIPESLSFEDEFQLFQTEPRLRNAETIIFDVSNPITYRSLPSFSSLLEGLQRQGRRVVVMDGMPPDSVATQASTPLAADWLITPYVGAPAISGPFRHLRGADYVILNPAYFPYIEMTRVIRPTVQRILVTMGQSDPACMTPLALASLLRLREKDAIPLEIRVVVGSLFSESQKSELRSMAAGKEFIEFLESPSNLAEHLWWSDLCLSSSGLTKYELATMGTPALFLSHSDISAQAHEGFSRCATGYHLGVVERVTEDDILKAFRDVASDREQRHRMSDNGRALVDGRGHTRIIQSLFGGTV